MTSVGQNPSRRLALVLTAGIFFCVAFAFSAQADTAGANSPSTTVDDSSVGTVSWLNPNNAQTNNGTFATAQAACFVAGTLIKTPMGDVPIESIQQGQLVYGFDSDQKLVAVKVNATESFQTNEIVMLMTDSGFIVTTPDHPFYTGDGTFERVEDLEVGTPLYDSAFAPHPLLVKIPLWVPTTPVYNLNVDGVHDFFANDFAVHNKG